MLNVAVFDDENIVVESICMILKSFGEQYHVVGCANNGFAAMKIVQEKKPDVIITDIRMPGRDGLSLLEMCQHFMPDLICIVISGYRKFDDAHKAIGLGVLDYIEKPVTAVKLSKSMQRAQEHYFRRVLRNNSDSWLGSLLENLVQEIYSGNLENLEEEYTQFLRRLRAETKDLNDYRNDVFMMTSSLVGACEEAYPALGGEQCAPTYHVISSLQSQEEMEEYCLNIIKKLVRMIQAKDNGTHHRTIDDVIHYANNHFCDDLSLQAMADRFSMNPAYLSTLFKEETGINYIKYLTNLRIEEAKRLLLKGYLVRQTGELVGYPNFRYFCDIFKKNVGITPNEFKGTTRAGKEKKE